MFDQWAKDWGVPPGALADLKARLGIDRGPRLEIEGNTGSETRQQGLVRLDANDSGVWMTRNNVGVLLDKTGRPVRYGLANESAAQNREFKSSDLIGIRPILVGPHHVGTVIGQFCARECKHQAWVYSGDAHERGQLNFINFINAKGGDAKFATGRGSFN